MNNMFKFYNYLKMCKSMPFLFMKHNITHILGTRGVKL